MSKIADSSSNRLSPNRPAAGRRLLSDETPRAVYGGGNERLGDVRQRITDGGQVEFVARDRQQVNIGVYDTWAAAAAAIVRKAWGAS